MKISKEQMDRFYKVFLTTIFEKSAEVLKVPVDYLYMKYNSDKEVRKVMNTIVQRHIDTL
tara:strand:+ start:729 stop:908 length:180 start_codon:yes stop_codon:yes gene_type:complete